MAVNISYRHDNTKYRFEIIPGSPSVYRLIPEQKNIGSIRRLTLGERDPTKINKTILLVGETETGKSSLINALVNYALGVKFEDNVCFQIVEEEKKSQSETQTSDVIVYEVFGHEDRTLPFSLTIIDTPGFGHTKGIEQDVLVSERLLDLFRSTDGVHEIDAVCLVLKGIDNRLSDRLTYVFDSVVSLFGKDIEKNIVALITYSDFLSTDNVLQALKDAQIGCAKDKEGQPVHFMFNNRQNIERMKRNENERALKNAWESTDKEIGRFADFLKNKQTKNLKETVEVLNSRIRLTACIHNLQERIEFIELKQREIQQTQEGLKKHEQDMKNNKDFTIEVDEVYTCKEPVSESRWWAFNYGGAVCCEVCEETCHYPCPVTLYPRQSEVMQYKCTICNKKCSVSGHKNELYCTVCTGQCHVSNHVNEKQCIACEDECSDPDHLKTHWRYVNKTRRVKKTIQQMKEMFEKGKKDSEKSVSLLETLQEKMTELQKDKDQRLEESFQHVV
ncbi:uncharacterized protein LOC117470687 [Trematomus bernacchii]|uniref:uncharacterized protein LOC117470687 n=1 Tax=Trematomus bernacchii TaxID=40690 RepID=UPI00146C62F4|nr:uncharacterized protein LOC117470687 [Trematomus bernacchii]